MGFGECEARQRGLDARLQPLGHRYSYGYSYGTPVNNFDVSLATAFAELIMLRP